MFLKLKDKNLTELIKGSFVSLFLKVLGMLFGYLAMLFVTNHFGAKEWGVFSLCFTILSITILLPKFGFDNSLVRIITELNVNKNINEIVRVVLKAVIISLCLSVITILLIYIFSDAIVKLSNEESIGFYIKTICLAIIPVSILTIFSAVFQALKKTALYILFQTTLINIIFFITLIYCNYTNCEVKIFELYFFSICIAFFFGGIFLLRYFFLKKPIQLSFKNGLYSYKSIINISLPMLFSNSFALMMGWSDIIILSYFKTSADVGIFDSVLRLSMLSSISLIAINAIATPKFVEFYSKKDIEGLKDIVQKSTKLIFYTSTPILLTLIFFSKTILSFFGEEFIAGYIALICLCASRFVNAISGSVGYIMQMTDQQKVFKNILIIALFLNVILNLILIPNYSFLGAAIASSITMVFWNITLVLIIKKKFGFWTIFTFNTKKKII
jgi:O-antigen/teichoic acid export membrane protein